jgi:hypothetical protein
MYKLPVVLPVMFMSTLLLGQANTPHLEPLPVSTDGYMVGRHLRRLDFAARECGGSFNSAKVDLLDRAGQAQASQNGLSIYLARSSNGFNDEGKWLMPLRGTDEVCQRLYKLYGPNGITIRGAYDPTANSKPAEAKAWWAGLGITPRQEPKASRPKRAERYPRR